MCKPCYGKWERQDNWLGYKYAKLKSRAKKQGCTLSMNIEEFKVWFPAQTLVCAICGEFGDCVDHCHLTGIIRGILCDACNMALGVLEDRLQASLDYLAKSR